MDPLVSEAELATYLGRSVGEEAATLAVATASGIVRDYCRWCISSEETTFVVDGSGTSLLGLPTLRLVEVAEVRIDGVVIDPSEYSWSERGQLSRVAGWPARFRCVEADVTHGWSPTPDSVRAVVLALASSRSVNPEGLRSKTVGAVSKSYVVEAMRGDLSDLQMSLISGYRLP